MKTRIRVFLADDHAVVRSGVRHLLEEVGDFEVIGEASTGREVLDASLLACRVLVLDLSLPVVSGLEVLRRVRAKYPELAIVVLSMHPSDQFAGRALAAGAIAYVSKERPPSELIATLRAAAEGRALAPAPAAAPSGLPHETLTKREHQVFMLLLEGRAVADIAAEFDVHSCTVSNHLTRIRNKLGVTTNAEIMRYAVSAGIVHAPPLD